MMYDQASYHADRLPVSRLLGLLIEKIHRYKVNTMRVIIMQDNYTIC